MKFLDVVYFVNKVILLLFFVFDKFMLFDKVEVLLYGVFKIVDELFELDIEFGLF